MRGGSIMSPYMRIPGNIKSILLLSLTFSAFALNSDITLAKGGGGHSGSEGGGKSEIRSEDGGHRGGDRHSGEIGEVHGGRHGSVVRELPRGASEITVRGNSFFYNEGRFFNRHHDGFIIVHAPIGAVVATLPSGFVNLSLGGSNYYVSDDTYYQRGAEGFIVVAPPHR
jgi:hypothetical protein